MSDAPASPTGTTEKKDPPAPARKGPRIIFIVVAIALVIFAVIWFSGVLGSSESTDDAQVDGHIYAISSRISGNVIQVTVEENKLVKQGDVLVQIDPRDYNVALIKAKADLADAVASAKASRVDIPLTSATTSNTLANTRAGEFDAQRGIAGSQRAVEATTARVSVAKAKLDQEQANYERTAADEARYRQLVQKDEISKQQYDTAVAAVKAQQAAVESAKAGVIEAQQNVDVAKAQVEQQQARLQQARAQVSTALTGPQQVEVTRAKYESAEAKVQQQQAAVDQAQLNLSYGTIVAPVTGIVGKKTVEVGQNVSPGQQLMAIVPTDDLWITANFKETQLRKMKAGQRVKVHVDTYGRDYEGYVESLAAASGSKFSLLPPENATGNYVKVVQRVPVRIRLKAGQDPDHLLRPGMSVVPKVYLQ